MMVVGTVLPTYQTTPTIRDPMPSTAAAVLDFNLKDYTNVKGETVE
jgi:hypothetical protein